MEGNRTPQRTSVSVAALNRAYATGRVNQFDGGLRWTPVIETRGYTDPTGDFHDRFRSWTMRERLVRANGNADNHVSVTGPAGAASAELQERALADMDAWLTARTRLAAAPKRSPGCRDRAAWPTAVSRPRGNGSWSG